MNNFTGIAALLFLLLTTGIFGKDKPEEPNPEVEKAVEISNIRHSRMPAFRLSATITLTVDEKGPLEGKYVFLKSSDGNWREELFLPGYSRLRVGDEHNYWQARSLEYDPLPIQNIDDLLDFSRMLSFEKKRKLTRPSKIRKEGVELSCQHSTEDLPREETICFDPSNGELAYRNNGLSGLQSSVRISAATFADYQTIAEKRFPKAIKGFNGKKLLVDIHVNELKETPDLETKLFAVPEGASRWLYCESQPTSKLSYRVQPDYPKASRERHEQGVVTFYAVIAESGKIVRLFRIQSASADLDKSSAAAVSHWRYEQPMCAGIPGPVETIIDVIFKMEDR